MRKFYFFAIALFVAFSANAQTVIDISAIDAAYTKTVNDELVIDVATTCSAVANPKLSYANPFKDLTFSTAEISFDVYTYFATDSIKVLGSLLAIYDPSIGRLYFSNGSYLGYNDGEFIDANMFDYRIDNDFIGSSTWKNIKLQFTSTGFAMYVDNVFAFNQSSTDVTIAGNLTDYNKVINFLKNASTFVIGTGSWWSDNTRPTDGTYWDAQFSYLKNITLTPDFIPVSINESIFDANRQLTGVEYYSISGARVGNNFQELKAGIYIKRSYYSNGETVSTKIGKMME